MKRERKLHVVCVICFLYLGLFKKKKKKIGSCAQEKTCVYLLSSLCYKIQRCETHHTLRHHKITTAICRLISERGFTRLTVSLLITHLSCPNSECVENITLFYTKHETSYICHDKWR